jgi:ElaB/YqjD/DUF883 family membrane-anchored ribosome-binding protein
MDQLNNQDLERNFRDREQTRTALARKLETLETRMRDNIEQVKESVRRSTDLRYHVDKRPWTMIGLSIALGVVAGRLVFPPRQSFAERSRSEVEDLIRKGSETTRKSFQALAENINLDQYAQHWGVIKKASLGVLASLAGEFARQVMPAIMAQLDNYSKNKNFSDYPERVQEATNHANERIQPLVQ